MSEAAFLTLVAADEPDMDLDLVELREAYARGENITTLVRQLLDTDENPVGAIEVAYDLQAGNYVDFFHTNRDHVEAHTDEFAGVVADAFPGATSLLDGGCGELTNSSRIYEKVPGIEEFLAFDLSWSRVHVGRRFFDGRVSDAVRRRTTLFVADMRRIPLPDQAVDVVLTAHALEPNHGRERELLVELARVARRGLVLLEPSYELTDDAQRRRMERLGYVRGLPEVCDELGLRLVRADLLSAPGNEANRTAAYVVELPEVAAPGRAELVDPVSRTPLRPEGSFLYSPHRGIAYPVLRGLPVLRPEVGVLATALDAG